MVPGSDRTRFFPRPSSRAVSVSFSRFSLWKVEVVFLLTTGGADMVGFCDVLITAFFMLMLHYPHHRKVFQRLKNQS